MTYLGTSARKPLLIEGKKNKPPIRIYFEEHTKAWRVRYVPGVEKRFAWMLHGKKKDPKVVWGQLMTSVRMYIKNNE